MHRRVLATLLFLPACNVQLPPEYFVEDLRILNLKVSPPEITVFERGDLSFDPMNPPPIDRRMVRVEALVAHPDLNATISFDWFRCKPGLEPVPCDAESERLTDTPTAALAFSPIDRLFSDIAGGASLGDVGLTLAEDPRDLLNGLYAYVNLNAAVAGAAIQVDTQNIDATKRIVIFEPRLVSYALRQAQLADPEQIEQARQLGLPALCSQAAPGTLNDLDKFLRERPQNTAPIYSRVVVDVFDAGGTLTSSATIGNGETIRVPAGGGAIFQAVLRDTDEEKYKLIDANCALQELEERTSVAWFTQLGELSQQITVPDDNLTSWTSPPLEELTAEQTRARIWSVMRDGRGGSDHLFFDLELVR